MWAGELKIGGGGTDLGTIKLLAKEFSAKYADIQIRLVPNLGSSGGVKAVADGAINLAFISRPLNAAEALLGLSAIEYARTPFVFAVAANANLSEITRHEVAAIYAGKQASWPDGSLVRIVLRPRNDSDTQLLKSISSEIRQGVLAAESRPGVKLALTDQGAADDLEKIPGAIGTTTLALLLSEDRRLKSLRFDGKAPAVGNRAAGDYPFFKQLFLVADKQHIEKRNTVAIERFIAFVLSPAGKKILLSTGHLLP